MLLLLFWLGMLFFRLASFLKHQGKVHLQLLRLLLLDLDRLRLKQLAFSLEQLVPMLIIRRGLVLLPPLMPMPLLPHLDRLEPLIGLVGLVLLQVPKQPIQSMLPTQLQVMALRPLPIAAILQRQEVLLILKRWHHLGLAPPPSTHQVAYLYSSP